MPLYQPTSSAVSLTVEEEDGAPSVAGVTKIQVPNSSLTNDSGTIVSLGYATSAEAGAELLGITSYGAGTASYSTTSATIADVDATNVAVAFTAPASGNVIVRMTAPLSISAAQNAYFAIRESTTEVGAKRFVGQGAEVGVRTVTWYITGIDAGAHTYKGAFSVNGGATLSLFQEGAAAGNGAITLEVWAA